MDQPDVTRPTSPAPATAEETDQQKADRLLLEMHRYQTGSTRRWSAFNALEDRAADDGDVMGARWRAEDYDQNWSGAETALLNHIRDTGTLPARWQKCGGRPVELPYEYVESTKPGSTRGSAPGDPCRVGDVGGDDAVTSAWGRRFVRRAPLADGTYAVIDLAYYIARDPEGAVYVSRETSYTLCADPTNPGAQDTWADVRYDRVFWPDTGRNPGAAYTACAAVRPELLTWDGRVLTDGETHPVAEDLPDTEL